MARSRRYHSHEGMKLLRGMQPTFAAGVLFGSTSALVFPLPLLSAFISPRPNLLWMEQSLAGEAALPLAAPTLPQLGPCLLQGAAACSEHRNALPTTAIVYCEHIRATRPREEGAAALGRSCRPRQARPPGSRGGCQRSVIRR